MHTANTQGEGGQARAASATHANSTSENKPTETAARATFQVK